MLSLVPSVVVFGLGFTAVDRVLGALAMVGGAGWLAVAATVTAGLSGVFRTRLYRELPAVD
ncbi:hypothetical protein [Kitasatospora sp. NPDC097643]|uniref:hypothetical protein n=1 Tax=Kitasatospora sp. NPDC097643 TaxID=3157230 RepID=UPI00332478E2